MTVLLSVAHNLLVIISIINNTLIIIIVIAIIVTTLTIKCFRIISFSNFYSLHLLSTLTLVLFLLEYISRFVRVSYNLVSLYVSPTSFCIFAKFLNL
jgi:hypothetical protein